MVQKNCSDCTAMTNFLRLSTVISANSSSSKQFDQSVQSMVQSLKSKRHSVDSIQWNGVKHKRWTDKRCNAVIKMEIIAYYILVYYWKSSISFLYLNINNSYQYYCCCFDGFFNCKLLIYILKRNLALNKKQERRETKNVSNCFVRNLKN